MFLLSNEKYEVEYVEFLINFNSLRDYFECHELLEEIWMEEYNLSIKKAYQALIQFAVGFYHWRRNNNIGATKTFIKCLKNMELSKDALYELGLDYHSLVDQINTSLKEIEEGLPYHSVDIVMNDDLTTLYSDMASMINVPLRQDSNLLDTFNVNKHALRKLDDAKIKLVVSYMEHFNLSLPSPYVSNTSYDELKIKIDQAIKSNQPIQL